MKKLLFAAIVCMLTGGAAFAVPSVDVTREAGHYISGTGGEFRLTADPELQAITGEVDPYSSFCLEKGVVINIGAKYDVVVSTEAIPGGPNNGLTGPTGGDLLDPMTAFLYTEFRAGTLAGYDYDPLATRASSAAALQEVIWYIEDETAKSWTDGDNSLQDQFYTAALNSGWNDTGRVRVLNLYTPGHVGELEYQQQDQLTLMTIPAPGAGVLACLGFGLVNWYRRRKAA